MIRNLNFKLQLRAEIISISVYPKGQSDIMAIIYVSIESKSYIINHNMNNFLIATNVISLFHL